MRTLVWENYFIDALTVFCTRAKNTNWKIQMEISIENLNVVWIFEISRKCSNKYFIFGQNKLPRKSVPLPKCKQIYFLKVLIIAVESSDVTEFSDTIELSVKYLGLWPSSVSLRSRAAVTTSVLYKENKLFIFIINKKSQGTPGFEPGTSRSAVECSTTELYPHMVICLVLLIIS